MRLRPASTWSLLLALPLGSLAAVSPVLAQDTCVFQSHQVEPARPASGQPFTVTVTFIASCYAFFPPVVEGETVSVEVMCSCPIDPSPPPMLWERSVAIPGLPAGTWAVEFRDAFPPEQLLYRFALTIGTILDIPTTGTTGALLLVGLLLLSALTRLRRRRRATAGRL